jgi:sugar lactone lactonase YvrE
MARSILPSDLPCLGDTTLLGVGDGRVSVFLFWSASSAHCQQALAVLDWLQVRFAALPLSIVSVHVPRSEHERGVVSVERACQRHGVRHTVVVDDDGEASSALGIDRVPTLLLFDANGEERFRGPGVPDRTRWTNAVEALCAEATGEPVPVPRAMWPEVPTSDPCRLRFPTGLAVDEGGGVLWIADTGHNRVLAVGIEDGLLRHTAGTGQAGATDGDLGYATFCSPRGLSARDGACFVADAGNHLVRCIEPLGGGVRTVLGQGQPVADRAGGRVATEQGIFAPWDVAWVGDDLFVALAGTHQVWQVGIGDGYAYAWAGVGEPGSVDGMRHDARFAQPAALAEGCDELAVADADGGTIRIAGISTQQVYTPESGSGFTQPRGVAWHRGDVLVADSGGGRVVRISLRTGSSSVVLGGLERPEGLAVVGDTLFVVESDVHRILRVDLVSGNVEPFELRDPHPEYPGEPRPPIRVRTDSLVRCCFPMPVPVDEFVHPEACGFAHVRSTVSGRTLDHDGPVSPESTWGSFDGVRTGVEGPVTWEVLIRVASTVDIEADPHVHELRQDFEIEVASSGDEVVELGFG